MPTYQAKSITKAGEQTAKGHRGKKREVVEFRRGNRNMAPYVVHHAVKGKASKEKKKKEGREQEEKKEI